MAGFRVRYDIEYNDGTGLYRMPKAPELIKAAIAAGCDAVFFDSLSDYDPIWFDSTTLSVNYGDQIFFNPTDQIKFLWLSEPATGACLDNILTWLDVYAPGESLLISDVDFLAINASDDLLISTEGAYGPTEFVYEVDVLAETLTVPAGDTLAYNAEISFDDGATWLSVTAYNDANLTHTYAAPGTYLVRIKGTFPWLYCDNGTYAPKIVRVIQWGDVGATTFESSFYGCSNLVSIPSIPYVGTNIEQELFYGCSSLVITNLVIPDGIIAIEFYAFRDCTNVTGTLTFPDSLTNLAGGGIFQDSGVGGTLDLNNVTILGIGTFEGTALTGAVDLSNVTAMSFNCFKDCTGITSVTLSTTITNYAFGEFNGCTGLTGTLVIPNATVSLSGSMFRNTGITGLTIGTGLTTISDNCFLNCSLLAGTLTLPSGITSIGSQSFNNCPSITRVDSYPSTAPSASANSFNLSAGVPLHIPIANSGYGVSPWTDNPPFSSVTNDL